jgi:hypothetical protein
MLVGKLVGYRAGAASAVARASNMECVYLAQRYACLAVKC